jgi:UDP-glucose 4-epimerase
MNILVTGGAGFIGSALVDRLLDQGHRVWTLDNLSNGRLTNLDQCLNHPQHSFVNGSICDRELVSKLMHQVDAVFHMAAVLGVKNTVERPLHVIEGNVDGTKLVLELAYALKIKVIFASTSEIYGKNNNLPFHELSDRVLGAPSVNRWCYATAKAFDEHLCFAYRDMGLRVTILRYFNTYGPRQTNSQYGGVVARFVRAALSGRPIEVHGDGKQTRCFTYVKDAVRGTVEALRSSTDGMAINIGRADPIEINQLAVLVKSLTSSRSPIIHKSYDEAYGPGYEDMQARIPDISLAKKVLSFQPIYGLEQGLLKTIDWYRKKGIS